MADKTAVVYCRVSTARQADEELPIASQRQRCEERAEKLGASQQVSTQDDRYWIPIPTGTNRYKPVQSTDLYRCNAGGEAVQNGTHPFIRGVPFVPPTAAGTDLVANGDLSPDARTVWQIIKLMTGSETLANLAQRLHWDGVRTVTACGALQRLGLVEVSNGSVQRVAP